MAGDLGALNILLSLDMSEFTGPLSRSETMASASARRISDSMAGAGKGTKQASEAMHEFSLSSASARRELIVLAHEASQGSWKNFGGSLLVLAERTDALSAVMSPAGLAIGAVAGALAAVGLTIAHGHAEWEALNKAVSSTGGAIGLTATQINALAPRVQIAGASISEAESALTALAATGKVSGDQLADFGLVAIEMAHDTGEGIDKVAANLAGLSDDAVKWAQSYNDQHHFMTAAQYDLAKSLEDTGDKAGAAKVVIDALHDAHVRMATEGGEQVGLLQAKWNGLVVTLQNAKHWLGEIGKPSSTDDKIGSALTRLDSVNADLARAQQDPRTSNAGLTAGLEHQKQQIEQEIAQLRQAQDQQRSRTNANASTAAGGDLAITLGKYNDDMRYASPSDRHDLEVNEEKARWAAINTQYQNFVKGNDNTTAKFAKGTTEYARAVADRKAVDSDFEAASKRHGNNLQQIADQYAKSQHHGGEDNARNAALTKLDAQSKAVEDALKTSIDHIKALRDAGALSAQEALDNEHAARQKALADELAIVHQEEVIAAGKKQLSALERYKGKAQQLRDAMLADNQSYTDQTAVLAAKQQASIAAYVASLDKLVAARQSAISRNTAGAGLGDQSRDEMNRLNQVQDDYAQRVAELTLKRQTHPKDFSDDEYQADLAALEDYQKQRVALELDATQQIKDAQGDWLNGATRSMENYRDTAADVAAQTAGLFTDAFTGMEDALVTFATTGKLSFKSMADSIIKDLIRMEAKAVTSQLFQYAASAIGSYFGGGSEISSGDTGLSYNANYSTASSSVGGGEQYSWLAGARAGGGSVDANRTYLVGEKGPELFSTSVAGSIVPNHQLTGSGGGGITVNSTVQLADGGATSQTSGDNAANAKALQSMINQQVVTVLVRESKPGGVIWKQRVGQA
ncbi:phage tail tape measure protein [Silvimonas sp.]|uniref:phage tail tape measure protein n=1 Tax=Silvimonas sp. TaxID=2650811 RepID=UPI0028410BD3|nr:phage tail tape measure protein [Silvimonas sp.]MDR3427939.1 phage tail tape measure protein [Silvimonas sp.]